MGGPAKRSRRRRWPWVVAVVALLGLGGGYLAADAADLVPGPLTTLPPWPDAQPYPTVPGATASPVTAPALDPAAPQPSAAGIEALIAALEADPAAGTAAVLVRDVTSGTDLGARAATTPMVPASTTKLLTAVAALDAVGPEYRFRTGVTDSSAADPEALTLVAGGDLTLAADAGDPEATIGHAGLGDLARAVADSLRAQGRTTVSAVVLDDSAWTGPLMPPRWDQADLDGGWAMPMRPLAVNIGQVQGTKVRDADAALSAARLFATQLAAAGITVTAAEPVRGAAAGTELGHVESAPLRDIVAYTLIHSENILAEGLGRLAAAQGEGPVTFEGAGLAIAVHLDGLGIDTAGLHLDDASGLSGSNTIGPRTLVDTVTLLANGTHPALHSALVGMPVAGLEGTLADRYPNGAAAAGVASAKTGTLRTVVSMAGYVVTADGRLLAFAVMTNNVPEGALSGARAAVDTFVDGLAGCGCR